MARSLLFPEAVGRRLNAHTMKHLTGGPSRIQRGGLLDPSFRNWAGCAVVGAALLAGTGCDRDPPAGPEANKLASRASGGIVQLTGEERARAGIEMMVTKKQPVSMHREFSGTVQANENELAEVTTLIRGRVVEVSVDVGRDVKKGER